MRGIKRWAAWGALWCGAVCAQSAAPGAKPSGPETEPASLGAAPPRLEIEVQAVRRELLPAGGLWVGDGVALSEAGGLMLEALVTLWRREFLRVDRVRVVGHVQDPQAQGERAMALQRAKLVQQGLMAKGGRQWRFQIEVMPLNVSTLSGCGGIAQAKLAQDCPLDSRMVAVEVLGVRR